MPKQAKKLKVLFLHGFTQNALRFRSKTGGESAEFAAAQRSSHVCHTGLQAFRTRLCFYAAIRKAIKGVSDHVFADAPIILDASFGSELGDSHWLAQLLGERDGDSPAAGGETPSDDDAMRSWYWFTSLKAMHGTGAAIEHINALQRSEGPFHAIFGFSQGAAVAASYAAYLHGAVQPEEFLPIPPSTEDAAAAEGGGIAAQGGAPSASDSIPPPPEDAFRDALKCVVLAGAFKRPGIPLGPLDGAEGGGIPVASLHIMGETDDIIPTYKSAFVAKHFEGGSRNAGIPPLPEHEAVAGDESALAADDRPEPIVVGDGRCEGAVNGVQGGHRVAVHPGGHYVPNTKEVRSAVEEVLREVREAHADSL